MQDAPSAGLGQREMRLTARVLPASAWSGFEPTWASLFEQTPGRSFFTSPLWVGTWLRTFGTVLDASIIAFESNGETKAAAILVDQPRALPSNPLHRLFFHTNGERPSDSPVAEHASLVASPDAFASAVAELGSLIAARTWDEFVLNGTSETAFAGLSGPLGAHHVQVEWRPSYYVDLAGLRAGGRAFESVLSPNARRQFRRALTLYERHGPACARGADTIDEAQSLFRQLVAMNLTRRDRTGGVFASERWLAFHEALIARGFPSANVQLVRVTAGEQTIGILYNLVEGTTAAFYQSAFAYDSDNRLKPGQVSHALIIEFLLNAGFDTYDLLAADDGGGSRYKASMSTNEGRQAWAVIRRRTLPGLVVGALRRARSRLR